MRLERVARNQTRTKFREMTFGVVGKLRKKTFRDDKLKNGIAQELQALIIKMTPLRFVSEAGVREGLRQQERITKFVSDALLERIHEMDS